MKGGTEVAEQTKVLDIGRGDENADWIKLIDGGKARVVDLLAGVNASIAYYTEAGEEENLRAAEEEKNALEAELAQIEKDNARAKAEEAADRRSDRGEIPARPE